MKHSTLHLAEVLALERQMLHGSGLVRKTWRSFDRLDRTKKEDRFRNERRTKQQFFRQVHFFSKR